MKTLTILVTFSLLTLSSASFANIEGDRPEKESNVPAAPGVWESPEIEAPVSLKFLKAKNAYVPLAIFIWGDSSEGPDQLLMVPVAPFVYGNSNEDAPEELVLFQAKSNTVPLAPFVWGDASEEPGELSLK